MTAHDQMRAMLDQLMGTGRNGLYQFSQVYLFSISSSSWNMFLQTFNLMGVLTSSGDLFLMSCLHGSALHY